VPVDDTSPEFAQAAAEDGIVLGHQSFDWLSEQGHFGLERVAMERRDPALREPVTAAVEVLSAIYSRLKGDRAVLQSARSNLLLAVDLVHEPTGTLIEVDEAVHFTSDRLAALDLNQYKELCRACSAKTDGFARGLPAKGFGFGGVQRERAYHDALRDLATPAMGHPRLVRIVALDSDGAAAYRRHRDALLTLLAP
jgi:hypothetical protein